MSTPTDKLQAEIDGLYARPLEQFTSARDELSKRLRAEGNRDAAAEVKRLRKPSLLAWALNQTRHRDPERVDQLIESGQRLQEAQEQLVSGGERGLLREAAADERRLVEEVAALAGLVLTEAGHPVGATLQSKLWSTVHAAALSPEPRDLLRAGRLLRDYEVSDLGLMGTGAPVPAPARGAPTATEERGNRTRRAADGSGPAKREARKAAERRAREIRRELERARAQREKLAGGLSDAQRRTTEARRQAAKAASELERAEANLEQLDARAAAVAARMRELETELSELQLN